MSGDYHHPGIFSFSNGFERSQAEHHIIQQIRRDKLRVQPDFEPPPPQLLVAAIHEEEEHETSGMLSEMFNFPPGTARELLDSQISGGYNHHAQQPPQHHQISSISAAATGGGTFSLFPWASNDGGGTNAAAAGEGHGLSLSLSSSMHHLDAAAGGDGTGMLFFSQGLGPASSEYPCKNNLNLSGGGGGGAGVGVVDQTHQIQVGFGSSFGLINGLRSSKYSKAAQELLEEFCSVVRCHNQFNKNKTGRLNAAATLNPNSNPATSDGGGGDAANNNSSPLSAANRIEHQRRKVKLLSMLDEVDRRYSRYCEQMQMLVNWFDMVMGFGAAVPYTALAQKAMSRHFRCLKDAVAAQLKRSCELLGEKDGGASSSGLTKGETPRLKLLEQSLRQQRTFHHMGMTEQEAWRPQRGLPERSVSTLRAWLFEHFLHPYPSDADKLMLARQTGLSRGQVSNWFINARVRLWKPMVEEMYQQEVKEEDSSENIHSPHSRDDTTVAQTPTPNALSNSLPPATTPTPPPATDPVSAVTATVKRSEIIINAPESDPSLLAINTPQGFSENVSLPAAAQSFPSSGGACHHHGMAGGDDSGGKVDNIGSAHISFGTNAAAGNVSLTLGLRHAGNLPDKTHFFG